MNITCIGRLQFQVQGQEDIYLVDLEENNLNGRCSCANYRFVRQKYIDRGESGQNTWCKHICAVRNHLTDKLIKQLSIKSHESN